MHDAAGWSPILSLFDLFCQAPNFYLPIASAYTKNVGLTHYLKGKIEGTEICILDHQESYKMNSFALADGFIEIEEACIKKEKGELVKVYLF